MKKQIIKATIAASIILTTALNLEAQPGGGGGQGNGGPPPVTNNIPIDGGAIFLAIGVAAYGRKMMKDRATINV